MSYNSHRASTDEATEIIDQLKAMNDGMGVDGETMEFIIEGAGMKEQMLRQLIMSSPTQEVANLLAEKQGI